MSVLDLIRVRAADASPAFVRAVPGRMPFVFDSPHSGTWYPPDFGTACDLATLRSAEDTHVEKLFAFAPAHGIAWIEALFPRTYVDVNRGRDELDPALLDGPWPHPLAHGPGQDAKVRLGKGLVWKLADDGTPLYARRLEVEEVQRRLRQCWDPYHAAVEAAIAAAHARWGTCLHLNCHSMPSVAASHATEHPGLVHPDIVLGDRDGTTADPAITLRMAAWWRERGYSVDVNHPYKGVELVRRHGDPSRGRHSLQLEINRRLYMDEGTRELHAGHERLQRHLEALAGDLLRLVA